MHDHAIHLICGSTGAGKTTYAMRLCARLDAVRFSIDEWMTALFWMDTPQPLEPAWSMQRVDRCCTQIWSIAAQIAARGIPCILDLGFGQAASRARFAGLAEAARLSVRLHFIDVPADVRWRRVVERNTEKRETDQLRFEVTREMFDFVETLWEPPSAQEMAAHDGVRITK